MKEARMILPIAWQSTVDKLTELFGGTTVYSAKGTWKSPNGTVMFESVQVVDVAYEPSDENDANLYDIAWAYRESASQEEVYLRYGNGHVQMVTELSCMDNGHGHFDLEFGGIINAMSTLTDPGKSFEDRVSAFEYLETSLVTKKNAA